MQSDSQFICSGLSDYQCSFDEDIIIEEETPNQTMARDLFGLPQFDGLNILSDSKPQWLPLTKKVLSRKKVAQLFLRPTLYSNREMTKIKTKEQKINHRNENKCLSEVITKPRQPIRQIQRRISGIEIKSTKQQRFDEEYPITIINEHCYQNQRQQSIRKQMFKRMSNILIKHTDSIKTQIQKHREKVTPQIKKQNEQDQDNISNNLEKQDLEENKKMLKKLQNKIFQLSNSPSKSRIKCSEQKNNIILDLHKKSHRAFVSVQNYLQEKSQLSCSQNTMPKLINVNAKCFTVQNTTEFSNLQRIQPQQFVICSLKQLPDLKKFRKKQNSVQTASRFSNIYLNSPMKYKKY